MARKKRRKTVGKPKGEPQEKGPKRSDLYKEMRAAAEELGETDYRHLKRFSARAPGGLVGGGALLALAYGAHLQGIQVGEIVGAVAGGGLALWGAWTLRQELRIPAWPARSAEDAMRGYLRALRANRWDLARSFLSEVSAEVPTLRPNLPGVGLEAGEWLLDSEEQLKSYWEHLCGKPLKLAPVVRLGWGFSLSGEREYEPGLKSAVCVMRITRTEQQGNSFVQTRFTYTGNLVAYEAGGAWRLLYGGLPVFGRLMPAD